MPNEVETEGGAEQKAAESQLNEAEILIEKGLYKPGLVENFDQLAKHHKGMESKFVEHDQKINELTSALNRRSMETAVRTEPEEEEAQPRQDEFGQIQVMVENTLNIKKMMFPDFANYETQIAQLVKSEPYKTMARRNLSQTFDNLYFMLKGQQAYATALNSPAEAGADTEIEKRRREAERLGTGKPKEAKTPMNSAIEKIDREISKADRYFQSTGGSHPEFEKQYGMSYAKYFNQKLEEKAKILNEMESEGG